MKIGMWLQNRETYTDERFEEVMEQVKNSDIDLFVFPEFACLPIKGETLDDWFEEVDRIATNVGKPIIFSASTEDRIFNYYINPNPAEDETEAASYIKHTMTDFSPLEVEDYKEKALQYFPYIILNGRKIGMTICYDVTHPIFSRMYGINGVDILINSTGGNVVYPKWYRYNQVRAIENNCFSFCTMGWNEDTKENSFVYGFDRDGNEMSFTNFDNPSTKKCNLLDSVYVYDTDSYSVLPSSIENTPASVNKTGDFLEIEAGNAKAFVKDVYTDDCNAYYTFYDDITVILVFVEGEDIMKPEIVCEKLFDEDVKKQKNKRYIIVNRWKHLDPEFLNKKLDVVLRVRASENYCAVLLESDIANKCYQCNNTKSSQEVKAVNNKFTIDLSRTSGPEAIWKDKDGMKAIWRDNYEYLLSLLIS